MSLTEFGATKRVWFAPADDPTDWNMFLARGDAYSKSVAQLGRTMRLGDPVDLGPNSTWRQTSWEGGLDQDSWSDHQMFKEGDLDVATKRGRIRLNPGFKKVYSETRTGVSRYVMGLNAMTLGASSFDLFFAESNRSNLAPGSPAGGFKAFRIAGWQGSPAVSKSDFGASVSAFSPINDNSPNMYVGTHGGQVWAFNGSTWTLEQTLTGAVIEHGMLTFNGVLYIGTQGGLISRNNPGSGPVYETFFKTPHGGRITGLANWNNRMWFATVSPGLVATLWVSDGVTSNEALTVPGEFSPQGIMPHYGSLYVFGSKPGRDGTSRIGQVWKYTGASLSLLWEAGDGADGVDHAIWSVQRDGPFLLWPEVAHARNRWRVGLMRYDAEVDAISHGPGFYSGGDEMFIHNIIPFNGTFFVDVWNKTTSEIALYSVKRDGTLDTDGATRAASYMISSEYDGDLPAVEKAWLSARITYRIKDPGMYIGFSVVAERADDDSPSPSVEFNQNLYYPGHSGWVSEKIDLEFLTANTLQYVLEVGGNSSTATVDDIEIDSIELNFVPLGERHWQWRMRLLCADNLNPDLPTKEEMVAKLESYWGRPLLFADDVPDGVTPGSETFVVLFNEYTEAPYRVTSLRESENAEVAIGFIDVSYHSAPPVAM